MQRVVGPYLQAGSEKCPLLKMMPSKGWSNSTSTAMPLLAHCTSILLICGMFIIRAALRTPCAHQIKNVFRATWPIFSQTTFSRPKYFCQKTVRLYAPRFERKWRGNPREVADDGRTGVSPCTQRGVKSLLEREITRLLFSSP